MGYSILDTIGNTPLVAIRHLNPNPAIRILAKLEYMNPGGSIKDRTALAMIEAGERSGELTPDKTVIEATSGNTGIGLALVCSVKGYRLLLAMSEAASIERRKILMARGAQILLTPGHMGTDGAIEEVYRLARENPDRYFMADQYNNPANWLAHYHGTAEEIWRQTDGKLTAVVATMGTTGTLMGISRRLKERDPAIRVIGVEPYLGHKIQGLKNMKEAYCPELYEKDRLDEKVNIDDEDAFEMTRRLAREEGLFVGMSSGAAMHVAREAAAAMKSGVLVVIFPDGGERYLSTTLFAEREKIDLKLYNTLARKKEIFAPIAAGKASVYSCGPTADRRLHPAAYRRFVFSDLLCRYLTCRGYATRHVMNITDYDDRTIAGAEKAGEPLSTFTEKHVAAFKRDLQILGVQPADHYPLASEHTADMVAMVETLVKKGYAYEKLRSVYFDISRFAGYGRLSGVDLNKIRLGATVDLDEYEKDNPRDFTLLKRSRLSELKRGIYIKTDWGNVRPSWHLQCAAICMKFLGPSFDIHTSGRELIFPHHENEIAIAGAITGKPLARFWLHCDRVMENGWSAGSGGPGNGGPGGDGPESLDRLLEMGYEGRDLRYLLLSTHYRKPLAFSLDRLDAAARSARRLDTCMAALSSVREGKPCPELDQLLYDIRNGFVSAMDDDLNISGALSTLYQNVRRINILITEGSLDQAGAEKILAAFRQIDGVLNLIRFQAPPPDPEIERLMAERRQARRARDWERADSIREELVRRGVMVQDGPAPGEKG